MVNFDTRTNGCLHFVAQTRKFRLEREGERFGPHSLFILWPFCSSTLCFPVYLITMAEVTQTLIFTYGTLKQGHGNHYLMQDLICRKDAVFLGAHVTHQPHPLVIGPHGILYLINLPGYGHRVKGELYSVSTRGLVHLDEL
ncbi:hypothetical protein DITRI_Ditri04bG0090600 [Diplodiscus trichospermus]